MSAPHLFSADQLRGMGETVTDASHQAAEQQVWGWLAPILKVDARPDNLTPQMAAIALELGYLAHSNPAGALESYSLGEERFDFAVGRRAELLKEARAAVVAPGRASGATGSFPPARSWPDPVERW